MVFFHNPVHRHYLILILFSVGALAIFGLAPRDLIYLLSTFSGWWVICIAAMLMSGKCQHCRTPIIIVKFLGLHGNILPKKCLECGRRYDEPAYRTDVKRDV